MGINLGDIIIEDDGDIYGDGVNVATRLEQLAEAGAICISGKVFDEVDGKLPTSFAFHGEKQVKNLARPVRVYSAGGSHERSPGARAPPQHTRPPSIAVLPFTNMSGDAEQEYFADGITEEIITALSHMRSFPVVARNSSFAYKGQAVSIQKVAQELGVTYVLEGSVRKAGGRVRVIAQLIDGISGHHIWADRYDRPLDDIFAIQDDITLRIALALQPELNEAELRKAQQKGTDSLTAWDYYLRGISLLADQTCADNEEARGFFQRAIEIDHSYGEAWAGLGWSHLRDYDFKCTEDLQWSLDLGLEAAQEGVRLAESSAFTHYVLSTAYVWREQLPLSLAELDRTLELNPFLARVILLGAIVWT